MSQDLKTILVVDDEQNIRFTLRSLLETDGFSVREAATSGEAIEEIERSHPVLVLLDLWLPGSDGMTVLEHLNQQPPRIRPRVVVLTAHGKVPVVVKAMRLGASDFLEKPTTPEDLRLSIAAALEDVADEPPEANLPVFRSRRAVHTDRVLARIRHAVWNQDIRVTENVLSAALSQGPRQPGQLQPRRRGVRSRRKPRGGEDLLYEGGQRQRWVRVGRHQPAAPSGTGSGRDGRRHCRSRRSGNVAGKHLRRDASGDAQEGTTLESLNYGA